MMAHLVAAVTGLKVSPLPLPVHVVDKLGEGPAAKLGAVFAAVAAVFSGIAVFIALKTLKRIDKQINLAQLEVDLVNQDLQNNKKMIDEALRRPDLRPVPQPQISNVPANQGEPIGSLGVVLRTSVANLGERIARAVMIEWLVPVEVLHTGVGHPTRSLDGKSFAFLERYFETNMVFWPNGLPMSLDVYFGFRPDIYDFSILLRFYDDLATYPRGGYHRFLYHREMPGGHVSLSPGGILTTNDSLAKTD
jgi:hypothetical protein